MDEIVPLIRQYVSFFGEDVRDFAGNLFSSSAIGLAEKFISNRDPHRISKNQLKRNYKCCNLIEKFIEDNYEENMERVKNDLNAGFPSLAFLRYFLGEAKEGKENEDINSSAIGEFGIQNSYIIHLSERRDPGTSLNIFLDYQGTIEIRNSVRDGIDLFTNHFAQQNDTSIYITSGLRSIKDKVQDLDEDVKGDIDGIVTIPKMINNGITGKLYTNLLHRLKAKYEETIVIANSLDDQSIEKKNPIITLLVPEENGASAKKWIDVIEFLRNNGKDKTIYGGAWELTLNPDDSIGNWRIYEIDKNTKLYRNYKNPNCFYLHKPKELLEIK